MIKILLIIVTAFTAVWISNCVSCWMIRKFQKYDSPVYQNIVVTDSKDSELTAFKIGRFLKRRQDECQLFIGQSKHPKIRSFSKTLSKEIFSGKNKELIEFIRVCHALGCEIEVRQISDTTSSNNDVEIKSVMNTECNSIAAINQSNQDDIHSVDRSFYVNGGIIDVLNTTNNE